MGSGDESGGRGKAKKPSRKALFDNSPMRLLHEISSGSIPSVERAESSEDFKPISLGELRPSSQEKASDEEPPKPQFPRGNASAPPLPSARETSIRPLPPSSKDAQPIRPSFPSARETAFYPPAVRSGAEAAPRPPSASLDRAAPHLPPPIGDGTVHPLLPPAHILLPSSPSEKDIQLPAPSYKPLPSARIPQEAPKKKSGGFLSGLFSSSKKTRAGEGKPDLPSSSLSAGQTRPDVSQTSSMPRIEPSTLSTSSMPQTKPGILPIPPASSTKPFVSSMPPKPPSLPSASLPHPASFSSTSALPSSVPAPPLPPSKPSDSKEEDVLSLLIKGSKPHPKSGSKPAPSPSGQPPAPPKKPDSSSAAGPSESVSGPGEEPGFSKPLFTPTIKPASEFKSGIASKGAAGSLFGKPTSPAPNLPGSRAGSVAPQKEKGPSFLSALFKPKSKPPSLDTEAYAFKRGVNIIVRDEPAPSGFPSSKFQAKPAKAKMPEIKPSSLVPHSEAKPVDTKPAPRFVPASEFKPIDTKPAPKEEVRPYSKPSGLSGLFAPKQKPPSLDTEAYALKPRVKLVVHETFTPAESSGPKPPEKSQLRPAPAKESISHEESMPHETPIHAPVVEKKPAFLPTLFKPRPLDAKSAPKIEPTPVPKIKAEPVSKSEPKIRPILTKEVKPVAPPVPMPVSQPEPKLSKMPAQPPLPAPEPAPSIFSQMFSPKPLNLKSAQKINLPKIGFVPSGRPSLTFAKKPAKPEAAAKAETIHEPEVMFKPASKPEIRAPVVVQTESKAEAFFKPAPTPKAKASIVSSKPLQVKPAPKVEFKPVAAPKAEPKPEMVLPKPAPESGPSHFKIEPASSKPAPSEAHGSEFGPDTLREEPSLIKGLLGALAGEKKAPPEPKHVEPSVLSDGEPKPVSKKEAPSPDLRPLKEGLPVSSRTPPAVSLQHEEEEVIAQPIFVKKGELPVHFALPAPGAKGNESKISPPDSGKGGPASHGKSARVEKGGKDLFKFKSRREISEAKDESGRYAEPEEGNARPMAIPEKFEVGPRSEAIPSSLVLDEGSIDRLKPADMPAAHASVPSGKPYMLEAVDPREFNVYYRKDMELPRFLPAECDRYFSSATLEQKKFLHALRAEQLYWRYKGEPDGSAGQRKCEAEFMGQLENSSAEQRIAIELAINLTKGIKAIEIFTDARADPKDAKEAYSIYVSLISAHPGVKPVLFYLAGRLGMKRAYQPNSLEPSRPFLDMISRSDDELRDAVYAHRAAFFDRLMNSGSASSALRQWAADRYARILMARPQVSSKLDHYLKVHQGLEMFFSSMETRTPDQQSALQEEWMRLINNHAPTRAVVYYLLANIFSRPPYVSALWRTVLERPMNARAGGKK